MSDFNTASNNERIPEIMTIRLIKGRKMFVWHDQNDYRNMMGATALLADCFPLGKKFTVSNCDGQICNEKDFLCFTSGGHADIMHWQGTRLPDHVRDQMQPGDGFLNMPNIVYASSFDEGDVMTSVWFRSMPYSLRSCMEQSTQRLNGEEMLTSIEGRKSFEEFVGYSASVSVVPGEWRARKLVAR